MRWAIVSISLFLLLPLISTYSQEVLNDPIVHLLTRIKGTEGCQLWKVETDLNADGKKEVFLTLSKWSNAKAGFTWRAYLPVEGGYREFPDFINFRKDAFLLDKSDVFGDPALVTYWAGGGGQGTLIAYQIWNDRIKETRLFVEPQRGDKDLYEGLIAKGTPIKIEVKFLDEYAEKGLIKVIRKDADKGKTDTVGEKTTPPSAIQVSVFGPRAMRDMAKMLGEKLNCLIFYEDAIYENADSYEPLYPGGINIPKHRQILFSYNPDEKPGEILRKLLAEYDRIDDICKFKVVQDQNSYSIIPSKYKNEKGEFDDYVSPLDAKISFSMENSTYSDVVEKIMELAKDNQGKAPVAIAYFPINAFNSRKLSFVSDGDSVRSCLNRLVKEFNADGGNKVSYNLARGPQSNHLSLNVYMIPKEPLLTATISVVDKRPLLAALRIIEQRFNTRIIYEDPLYLYEMDLLMSRSSEPLELRGGTLTFSYEPSHGVAETVLGLIEAFNKKATGGEFSLKRTGSAFYVFPSHYREENGEWSPYKAILETSISLSSDDETIQVALEHLCKNLGLVAKKKITLGTISDVAKTKKIEIEINPEAKKSKQDSAYNWLIMLLDTLGKEYSCSLLYMPQNNTWVLNVYKISDE